MMTNNQRIIYRLCVKNDWFIGGDNKAYSKLLELARVGVEVKIVARCIWLVSDDDYSNIEDQIVKSEYEECHK